MDIFSKCMLCLAFWILGLFFESVGLQYGCAYALEKNKKGSVLSKISATPPAFRILKHIVNIQNKMAKKSFIVCKANDVTKYHPDFPMKQFSNLFT